MLITIIINYQLLIIIIIIIIIIISGIFECWNKGKDNDLHNAKH